MKVDTFLNGLDNYKEIFGRFSHWKILFGHVIRILSEDGCVCCHPVFLLAFSFRKIILKRLCLFWEFRNL